tara:strand:- start:257 stop:535 length:279 start_codon:yes stop_codon:yes gene_type:complete
MAKKTFHPKEEIQKLLDKTDLDEKLVLKINDLLEEPKSLLARLKSTLGPWAMVEIATILFIAFPTWGKDYGIALVAALVWVALHKFNKTWIK